MLTGAQFYTVRDFCRTKEGFAESLKKVADIGYTTVQISGTCAYEPEWLDAELKKNGLSCVITHYSPDRIRTEPEKVAKEHDVFGCRYVGIGWYPFDELKENGSYSFFMDNFVPAGKVLRDNGKYLMYHNHDNEFRKFGGKILLRHIAEEIPADVMGVTLDTYWVQVGGGDPGYWLEQLKGRVPCIHLKDCAYGRKMAVIGEGNINFDRVFEKAESAGTKYMLVEQDDCGGEDPFECLRRSYENLKSFGFR